MPNKFSIGDKVKFNLANQRTSKELLKSLRLDHPRTIVAIFYDNKTQHTRYYLGSNRRGNVDMSVVAYRASQLMSYAKGKLGRQGLWS